MSEIYEKKQSALSNLKQASKELELIGQEIHDSAAMDYHHVLDLIRERVESEVKTD